MEAQRRGPRSEIQIMSCSFKNKASGLHPEYFKGEVRVIYIFALHGTLHSKFHGM